MTIKVRPGPVGTPLTRWRAERLQELRRTELEHIRKQGEQWRTGLAGFITVVLTAALVSGRTLIAGHRPGTQAAIGILMLTAVLATASGIFLSTRAAHGFPARPRRLTIDNLVLDDRRAARRSARDLRAAILTAGSGLLLFIAAIAVVWFGP
ncbi:hypothetical protein SAMN05421812_13524 [Asanoa hainanensis]|uniref:Uncharacterized protein n=1 Tax=Asanoa hainanensis TaxID=560556 RepID=A0A239PGN9_9ACTN|nr:hypothetical protein [Asanoa hainanensis]SNT66243.1 hypothetical protein SAMN05421812_13524 [Asanoa hainanensis]